MTTAQTTNLKLYEPYTDIKAELAKLAEDNDKAVFDYEDPKGQRMARSHIYQFRKLKGDVERRRKELKADVLDRGRLIDGMAKSIVQQIEDMIDVHEQPLLEIEQREKDRVEALQTAIDLIGESSETPSMYPDSAKIAEAIAEAIARVESIEISAEVYQERMAEATQLKDQSLADLKQQHAAEVEKEAEKAELARLRAEAAAREQVEREERIRAEAEAKAKAEAEQRERDLREQAERAEREAAEREAKAKADAQRREQQLQAEAEQRQREADERAAKAERDAKAAAKRAEQEKIEAEQRAEHRRLEDIEAVNRKHAQAKAEEDRKAEAARVKAEKKAANVKHRAKIMREVEAGIADATRGCEDVSDAANAVAEAIATGDIPHTQINF